MKSKNKHIYSICDNLSSSVEMILTLTLKIL